jgi:hypothetical protein
MVQCSKNGTTVLLSVKSYSAHSYQLQRADSLAGPWVNLGGAQAGQTQPTGEPTLLALVDNNATGPQRFYRVMVTP